MIDPSGILHVHVNEAGVKGMVTYGSLAAEDIIRRTATMIRMMSPALYADYRRRKHPDGKPGTPEDRRNAHLWLLQAALPQFVAEYYPTIWVSKG